MENTICKIDAHVPNANGLNCDCGYFAKMSEHDRGLLIGLLNLKIDEYAKRDDHAYNSILENVVEILVYKPAHPNTTTLKADDSKGE